MISLKCFYHGSDFDGKGSAAIVKYFNPECECIPLIHGKGFPWHKINPEETVYMVDFSIAPQFMIRLNDLCKEFIWIDHHISAIEEYEKNVKEHGEIAGLREDGRAAIELTWEYFMKDRLEIATTPLVVTMLGRYDVWDLDYDPRVMPFQYGLRLYDLKPDDHMWVELFEDYEEGDWVNEITKKGLAVLAYQKQEYIRYMKSYSFEGRFDCYKAIFVNRSNTSSQIFDGFYDPYKHDIMVCFVMTSDNRWRVTVYTDKDWVDCSMIARKYGGGGHAKAAGFVIENFLGMIEKD